MTNAKTSSLTGLKQRRIIGKVAFYVLGLLMAIIVCIPFYWMIITSLKGRGAIMSIPILIVYIFAQKYFKEGLTVGGVKG